jgi:glucosamine kinase
VGGYGFPVSDEGSGADLGLNALRHALRTLDGRAAPSAFSREVLARFSDDPTAVLDWLQRATPTDYATIAPLVVQHADAGDVDARRIMEQAGRHIAELAEALYERGAPRVALINGLARAIQRYMPSDAVDRLVAPEGDAMAGGILLAKRQMSASADNP